MFQLVCFLLFSCQHSKALQTHELPELFLSAVFSAVFRGAPWHPLYSIQGCPFPVALFLSGLGVSLCLGQRGLPVACHLSPRQGPGVPWC